MRILMLSDFSRATNFEESEMMLQDFLADESTEVFLEEESNIYGKTGNWIKSNSHLVARISNSKIKVEVFSNEEGVPHFRVKLAEFTANYRIKDCLKINGDLPLKSHKKVLAWYRSGNNQQLLIDKWNSIRPDGCQVGEYK